MLRFFIWKEGQDITKFFTEAPYCFTSQRSFSNQEPARESIETLEDSRIWQVRQEDAYALLRLESWSTFVRKLIQEVQYNTEEILEALQNDTAANRYKKMLEEQPSLVQRVRVNASPKNRIYWVQKYL